MKTKKQYRDVINSMKRVFDEYEVKREFLEDEFYMKLMKAATNEYVEVQKGDTFVSNTKISAKNVADIKMEIMINIDSIINGMKGTSRLNRISFGLDIGKVPLTVFLTESKLLLRNNDLKKSDIMLFFDDTLLRTGNRGFAITKDAIISNIGGLFKVFRFDKMDKKPEFHFGHAKDAIRVYVDEEFFDLKIDKRVKYCDTTLIIMHLLYEYANTY